MTRVVEVKPGIEMRIRGLRWDDGWRYGSPVALTNELQARVYRADEAAREAARVKPLGRVDVLETRIAMLEAMFAVSGRQRTL